MMTKRTGSYPLFSPSLARGLILAMLLMCAVPATLGAKEVLYHRFKVKIFDPVWKQLNKHPGKLTFDTKLNKVIFYFSNGVYDVGYKMSKGQRHSLIAIMETYLALEKKYATSGVEKDRLLGSIRVEPWFKYGNQWHRSKLNTVEIRIVSETPDTHHLVMSIPKLISIKNFYLSHQPDTIFLNAYTVERLIKRLRSRKRRRISPQISS